MKTKIISAIAYVLLASTAIAQSETCVSIGNNRRSTSTGKTCWATQLCYTWITLGGSTILYSYSLQDSLGTTIFKGEVPMPYRWQQGHADTVRDRIINQLELTVKP